MNRDNFLLWLFGIGGLFLVFQGIVQGDRILTGIGIVCAAINLRTAITFTNTYQESIRRKNEQELLKTLGKLDETIPNNYDD